MLNKIDFHKTRKPFINCFHSWWILDYKIIKLWINETSMNETSFLIKLFTKIGIGCSHNPMSQKGHWTTKKENQN
jgi:hypothetical protein